jgi:hypothetical protein
LTPLAAVARLACRLQEAYRKGLPKDGKSRLAGYDLSPEFPPPILGLPMQLNAQQDEEIGATVGNQQSGAS